MLIIRPVGACRAGNDFWGLRLKIINELKNVFWFVEKYIWKNYSIFCKYILYCTVLYIVLYIFKCIENPLFFFLYVFACVIIIVCKLLTPPVLAALWKILCNLFGSIRNPGKVPCSRNTSYCFILCYCILYIQIL